MTTTHSEPAAASKAANRRRITRRAMLGGALGVLAAAGGTGAWALDRFVVDHVEITDTKAYEASQSASAPSSGTGTGTSTGVGTSTGAGAGVGGSANVTGTSYTSDATSVTITTVVTGSGSNRITYFVADLRLTDPVALRAAFAEDKFGTNIVEYTSTIAKANGAVVAINGDYYGFRDSGIVVRNGVVYRDRGARQGLAIYRDGSMRLYDETATNAATLVADGVWQTLSFGPGLVADGRVVDGIDTVEIDTNFGNHSVQGQQPRTGVGMVDPGHLLFVVVDGRSSGYSRGVSMSEFAQIFAGLGARTAYNLDGGGSSALYFEGALVNNPLGTGQERGTSDILYVGG